MLRIILALLSFISLSSSQKQPNRNVTIPDNTFELLYSTDQKYLIAASQQMISLFYGHNGSHYQDLDLQGDIDVSSVAISRNNKLVAVGFKQGLVKIYDIQNDFTPIAIDGPKTSQVNSLCFTSDQKFLIGGLEDDLIVLYDVQQETIDSTIDFQNQRVFSVACSPTDSSKFVAGGGQGTLAKFSLYQITGNQTSQIVDFPDHNDATVLGSTYSDNGKIIYRAGQNGKIYSYQMTSQTQYNTLQEIDVGQIDTLYTVVVSKDMNTIATVNDNNAYIIKMDQNLTFSKIVIPTTSKTVALSSKGENVAVIGADNSANILGQCIQQEYFDGAQCQNCLQQCTLCQDSKDNCFECVIDHYLNGDNKCVSCGVGCLQCQQESNCLNCDTDNHFQKQPEGNCNCQDQYYLDNTLTCQLCSIAITNCISCSASNICDVCDSTKNRVPSADQSQCVCKPGYYQDALNQCQLCQLPHCLECSASDVCTQCDGDNDWIVNATTKQCSCMEGFQQKGDQCVNCPTGCLQCQNNTCTLCNQKKNFNPTPTQQGTCDCKLAYFFNQDSESCDICTVGCLNCNNSQTCIECNKAGNFIEVGQKCQCKDNTFYLQNRNCVLCSKSIAHCLTCSQKNKCTKCAGELKFTNNKCQCKQKQYISKQLKCEACPQECKTCQSQDNCTQCEDGYDLDQQKCKSSGLDGLIIVLIVVGVVFLLAAIFVVIKCIKKKNSNEAYEQLD